MANKDDVIDIIRNRTSIVISAGAPVGMQDIQQSKLDFEIDAAVRDYSMDEPRVVLVDKVPADLTDVGGVKFYELDEWDPDISDPTEVEIEFPVDQAARQILLQGIDLDFEVVERPVSGVRTFFIKFYNPPSGTPGTWRLKHMARFPALVDDADLDELTPRGVQMVGVLAASYAAMFLAGKFGKSTDPTLTADVVDYRGRSGEWRSISEKLFEEYQARLDRPSRIKRAGTDFGIVDLDLSLQKSNRFGRDYLVHRRRKR